MHPELNKICLTKEQLNKFYTSGYQAGHHDTVEGNFTDVAFCDYETYHDEIVEQIIHEL